MTLKFLVLHLPYTTPLYEPGELLEGSVTPSKARTLPLSQAITSKGL